MLLDRVQCCVANIVSNEAVIEMMWYFHDQVIQHRVPKIQRVNEINDVSGWFGVVSKDLLHGFRVRYREKYLIETNVTKTDINITISVLNTPDCIVGIHVSNSGVYADSIASFSNIDVIIEDVVEVSDVLPLFPLVHQTLLFGLSKGVNGDNNRQMFRTHPNFRKERYREGFTQGY